MKSMTNQTRHESEANNNSNGNECRSVDSGVLPSHDENRGIFSSNSQETHAESIGEKVRKKACLSKAVDRETNRHMTHVCVVCGCLNFGIEEVKYTDKWMLFHHFDQLYASANEEYNDRLSLHFELVKKYQVGGYNLNHLLPGSVFILEALNVV